MSWGIDKTKSLEEQLEDYRAIEDELDRKRETLDSIAVMVCETLSCDNCPVVIHNCDTRTPHEKKVGHAPCCGELHKWIINQAKQSK